MRGPRGGTGGRGGGKGCRGGCGEAGVGVGGRNIGLTLIMIGKKVRCTPCSTESPLI